MQIRTKITLYFISITASLLIISFFSIYFISANDRQIEFKKHILRKAITRANYRLQVKSIDSQVLKTLDYHKKDVLEKENISIYNENFEKIYTNNDKYNFSNLIPDLTNKLESVKNKGMTDFRVKSIQIVGKLYSFENKNYIILVGAKDVSGINQLEHLRKNLIYIFFGILSFIGLAGWLFSKKILQPISNVMNEVDAISEINLSYRLNEKKNKKDEISRLIHTFNQLLDRLDKAFQIQRAFISHASHELINPLSSISSQIEVTLLNERKTKDYQEILHSILDDIRRLNNISQQLIKLSKYSNIRDKVGFTKIRIDELIWQSRKEFLISHPDAIVQFKIEKLPSNSDILEIVGNETLLQTCINNIIDNGIKYSYDNKVEINLSIEKENLKICISNKGDGIPKDDLIHIFTPFYRNKQVTEIQGYGIGLSIVKTIAELHNIKISVESIQNQTTTFCLVFNKQKG
jgi:signal transduction histidine kinase